MLPVMNFPILSFDQMNPGLVRAQKLSDLLSSGFKNYGELQQARYAPEMAKAGLQKTLADIAGTNATTGLNEQKSKWYGPEAQSSIDLQGAQTNDLRSLLSHKIKAAELAEKYPMLSQSGITGDIERLRYARDNAKAYGDVEGRMQSGDQRDLTLPVNENTARAISGAGGNVQYNPQAMQQNDGNEQGMMPSSIQQQLQSFMGRGGQQMQQPNLQQALQGQQFQQQPPNAQGSSLLDMMREGVGSAQKEKQARANYMTTMPKIKTMQNPTVLSLASTNRDAARALAQNLSDEMGNTGKVTEEDVDNIMDYSGNVSEKKGTTAAIFNQRQFGANLDEIIKRVDTNMPAYAKYAGMFGKADLMNEKIKVALGGQPSPALTQYANAIKDLSVAAQDYKRTVGGQATDQETKLIDNLVSGDAWWNNSQLAMSQWNELKGLAQQRIGKALSKGAKQIRQELAKGGTSSEEASSMVKIQAPDGKVWEIPQDKVDEALKTPGVKRLG